MNYWSFFNNGSPNILYTFVKLPTSLSESIVLFIIKIFKSSSTIAFIRSASGKEGPVFDLFFEFEVDRIM